MFLVDNHGHAQVFDGVGVRLGVAWQEGSHLVSLPQMNARGGQEPGSYPPRTRVLESHSMYSQQSRQVRLVPTNDPAWR